MTPFKCSQEGSSVGRRVQVLAGGFKCWQEGSSVGRAQAHSGLRTLNPKPSTLNPKPPAELKGILTLNLRQSSRAFWATKSGP